MTNTRPFLTLRRIPRLRRWRWSPPASRSRPRSLVDTTAKGATFAEKHAEMVGHTPRSSPEERRPSIHFARVQHDHARVNGTVERI